MRLPMIFFAFFVACACRAGQRPIQLEVDATHVTQCLNHVRESIPVTPGALTLYLPKWIPGAHSPVGGINGIVDLHFFANGKELAWKRDEVEMFAFHLDIPHGATDVKAEFDEVFDSARSSTPNLARISFVRDVLYPAGMPSDAIQVEAKVRLPNGWPFATALPIESQGGSTVRFKPASLTTVVDSPIVAGKYFNRIVLADHPTVELDMAGDTPESVQMKPETVAKYKKAVAEQIAQFGAYHYRDYHFLVTFSDHGANAGLEHHECSEDGTELGGASDEKELGYLLCHEYTHSWNGKYRRPAGLATPDYEEPMQGELLWVYEGMTEYLGTRLSVRAGLWSPETYREALAAMAAFLGSEDGRRWRPLVDTATAAQILYGQHSWYSAVRGADYYYEGVMVWLEADAKILELTHGEMSLDDFCKRFHGGVNSAPTVKPYTFEDVVSNLNAVAPYDWAGFLKKRIYDVAPNPPVGGIEETGWKLVYTDKPNERDQNQYERGFGAGTRYSLGMNIGADGSISDLIQGGPAFGAGLSIGMKCVAVNGHAYSEAVLEEAIKARRPILLLTNNDGQMSRHTIRYTDGLKFPHLERDSSKPDLLLKTLAPRTTGPGSGK